MGKQLHILDQSMSILILKAMNQTTEFLPQTFMKYIIYNPGLKKIPIGQQHIHNKYWKNDVLN